MNFAVLPPTPRVLLAGCFLLAGRALAQTSPAPSPDAARPETVELSPFVVSTEKDAGFVAASSLAGGRLAGDLKDTPAAYSVLTREFIDALDLPDLISAVEWTVNSTSIQGAGQEEIFGNGFETSSRGVSASSQQRNFFPLNVNFDSYNLDRFDYSRGPNAILFGNGTFGGASNVVTKRALTHRGFGSVRLTYGSWEQRRIALDDNRPLGGGAAIRVNALWQDRQGWRDFEAEKKRALTIALTKQFGPRTELLLEGEVGRIERNNPPTFLSDQFLGWDGTTTFAGSVTNANVPSNAVLQAAGVSRYGNDTSPIFIFAPDLRMSTVENYANTMRTIGGGTNATTAVGGVPLPAGAPSVNYQTRPINASLNSPAWQFDRAVSGSRFRVPASSFAMSTLTPTNAQTYQTYSAFLRHRVGQNLFLELGGNVAREWRHTQYINGRSLNDVIIDLNRSLPNGQANPYFLDPYGQGQRSRGTFGNDYAGARLASAYKLERTRVGDFTFNLMSGYNRQDYTQRIESMRVLRNTDPRNWPFNDQVAYRYYWDGPTRTLPDITTATYNGVTYPVQWIGDSQRPTDISTTKTDFTYLQGAVKSRFFSNRLHVVLAGRQDNLTVRRTLNDNYGDYPANWDGAAYYFRGAAPADYLTLPEVRPRNASRIPTVTTGRYQDDFNPPDVRLDSGTYTLGAVWHLKPWMSVFGNYATSFNPSTSQLRLDGSIVPSPISKGWDAGLRFFLFHERINVSLTYYSGQETAQPFEIPFTSSFQNIANANVVGDLSTDGMNRRGLPVVPTQAFDLRDRKNHGYELEITANVTSHWRLSANAALPSAYQTNAWSDTRAFLAKWEPTMRQVLNDAGVIFNAAGQPVVDNSVPASQAPDAAAARTAWITIFQNQLPNIVVAPQKIPGLTEFTANLFTDYEFSQGRLKGLKIGAGFNYRGRKIVGFRGADTIQDPAQPNNPAAAIDDPAVDAFTPVYSPSYKTATLTLGYTFRLKERRRLALQLRIANLLNNDTPIYTSPTVQRAPGGDYVHTAARVATPFNFRYQVPRSFSLTTTLSY
jgi:outer membrane receptor protein involved in Fe transport